jgi:uncharacterized protein (DUF58 family)
MKFDILLARARRLELKSRFLVRSQYSGLYRSAFRGQGVEFSEVREYAEGDEVRLIDWNVSARHQSLYVKRMVEERERNVLLILDATGSLSFGSVRQTKFELLTEVGALLILAAFAARDRVSLACARAGIETFVPAAKGWNHAARLIRELASMEPRGAAQSLDPIWNFLNSPGIPRCLVFLLTDYQAPLQGSRGFSAACRKHEMVFVLATDPRERRLPNVGRIRVRHPESGGLKVVDTRRAGVRLEFERLAEERTGRVRDLLGSSGIDWVEVCTATGYEAALRHFLASRATRRLRHPGA